MVDWFRDLHPIAQALLAGGFTWLVTLLGAAPVLFTRNLPHAILDALLGFAAGVMIAASVWSLIIPAIEGSEELGRLSWLPAAVGVLSGGAFLRLADRLLPHLHLEAPLSEAEGPPTRWRRTTLLVLAITLHNVPEGLAVGVAFGAVGELSGGDVATLGAAVALAIGIGLQNFPEGLAVAMPLRREGVSRGRSFYYGQLSAGVEPIAAMLGAAAVAAISPLLPYALTFAAGAMLYVVVEELVPESQRSGHADVATVGTLVGFVVMMALDVALG
jgi:ZIP family zinc transporter